MQLRFRADSADLELLVDAAIPDPREQERAARDRPPAELLGWPWTRELLAERIAQARAALSARGRDEAPSTKPDLLPSA